MQVRDLQEVLAQLHPDQKLRITMTGMHTGENGPACRFVDSDPPALGRTEDGTYELRFSGDPA